MGLLSRFFGPPAMPALAPRAEPRLAPERRWAGDGWGAVATLGGRAPVASYAAENLAAVVAAVELIGGAVASLPAALVSDGPDGVIPAPATATGWTLLRRPNKWQGWPAFWQTMVASMLLSGNGLAMIERDGRGAVVALVPVPWGWVMPLVIQRPGGTPRLAFDITAGAPEAALLGLPGRLLSSDVLHIRSRSESGLIGRSALSRAAGVVREGAELSATAEGLFRNGLTLSGFVETGGAVLNEAQRAQFKASLADLRGPTNAGRTMLLEGPFKYNPLSIVPADAELLSSRKFSVGEIARLFNIPEPLLLTGERAVGNLDPFLSAFAQLALTPIVNVIETEFSNSVLPPGISLNLDTGGLLRGSFSGQVAALSVATQSGIMSANDARRALGLPTVHGGDELRPNGAPPTWPADAQGVPSLSPRPGHVGTGLPNTATNQGEGAA